MNNPARTSFFTALAGALGAPFFLSFIGTVLCSFVAGAGWTLAVFFGQSERYHEVFEPAAFLALVCTASTLLFGVVWYVVAREAERE